jgi:hypothetical protein
VWPGLNPSGFVPVYDDGLTCDAPGLGASGHCVKAAAAGDACDASVREGSDCGLGSYCDPETAPCQLATNRSGPNYSRRAECVHGLLNVIENVTDAGLPALGGSK